MLVNRVHRLKTLKRLLVKERESIISECKLKTNEHNTEYFVPNLLKRSLLVGTMLKSSVKDVCHSVKVWLVVDCLCLGVRYKLEIFNKNKNSHAVVDSQRFLKIQYFLHPS